MELNSRNKSIIFIFTLPINKKKKKNKNFFVNNITLNFIVSYPRVPVVCNDRSNVKKPVQSVQSESPNESKMASVPQSTTPTPTRPAAMCWASLFSSSSTNSNSRPNAEPPIKPIAKVPPYNSSHEAKAINVPTPITQQNIQPGVISYSSAASSTTNGNKRQPPTKARIAPTSKPSSSSQSDISIDETLFRLGGMCNFDF